MQFLQGYENLIYLSHCFPSPRLDLGFLVRLRRKLFIYYAAKPFKEEEKQLSFFRNPSFV
jgi:hypothetical protein